MRVRNCVTVLMLALITIACFAGWNASVKATAPVPRTKWEYTNRVISGNITEATNSEMSLFGVNGWELVTVYNDKGKTIFIYKRPL